MNKLSRKDIEMLEMLATTTESDDKLAEYIHYHKKAVKAYKAFREAVVSGVEVDKVEKVVEVKRKFKVGDKVRVLDTENEIATSGLRIGDVTEVLKYILSDSVVVLKSTHQTRRAYFSESALELVEEKTPNELRAEVIQRAKAVLVEWKDRDGSYLHPSPCGFHFNTRVEFKVNTKKRVVVALLRNLGITENIRTKGIASCSKSDVYNEHIGKAIALGRALGKDVSEFENAVQPDMPTVGHKFTCVYDDKEHEISVYDSWRASIEGTYECLTKEDVDLGHIKLVDDTDAQYGGVE